MPEPSTVPCTLEEVLYFVQKYYTFTAAEYPTLRADAEGKIEAGGVLDHSLTHLQKSTIGPLAALVEGYHHSGELPDAVREEVQKALAKALANIAAIAGAFSIDSTELCRSVASVMKSAPQPPESG